jgi:hypothetical protein
MLNRSGPLAAVIALSTTLIPSTAAAMPPSRVQMPVDTVADLPPGSLCPFDLKFTGTGTITVTTYYDNAGRPTSQTVHGALTHTIFRPGGTTTLTSNGPAPEHIDLVAGQVIETGLEFAFHVPGDGTVLGMAGRAVSTLDGTELSFAGLSVTDVSALCAALGP